MPTPKQRYRARLRDIANRFGDLEAETVRRHIDLLREMQERLQLQLTSAEGWNERRLRQLTANVDRLVARYEAQLIGLSNGNLRQSARLGALSVTEPLQAAGVGIGFFDPTPAQLNVLLDFSADLIRDVGRQTRQAINGEIRLAALGERSTIDAMRRINQRLGVADQTGIAYRGERILRTEMGRVYNLANHSQQQVTAQSVEDLQKAWLATGDSRTRISHLRAHNQVVPVNQPFILGSGAKAMYPLDPNLPAEESINCRCRMATVHPEIGLVGGPLDARVAKALKNR